MSVIKPEGLSSDMIFWEDCDVCGAWVHNVCASNSARGQHFVVHTRIGLCCSNFDFCMRMASFSQ